MSELVLNIAQSDEKAAARIAIAQDVLKSIDFMRVKAGTYFTKHYADTYLEHLEEQASSKIDELKKDCAVCALGACMMGYIKIFNKIKIKELINGNIIYLSKKDVHAKLLEFFTREQLDLIESAFELVIYGSDVKGLKAMNFGHKHGPFYMADARSRLRAIMTNIVQNNGDFCPEKDI